MAILNKQKSYSGTAKFLHWTVAALFIAEYCIIYARHWFTEEDSPVSVTMLQLHQTIGISIMVFVIWRIAWRITRIQPASVPAPKWVISTATFIHAALYFLMIAMPITGYLYASNATTNFGAFSIPAFEDTAAGHWLMSIWDLTLKEDIREPMRAFHRELAGAMVLWMLILVHVAAAIYHHFIAQDEVLRRMLPTGTRGK